MLLLRRAAPLWALGIVTALDNNTTRTPPMGMLNWGIFRCNVDCEKDPETCVSERNLKGQVDAMVEGGYVKAGYVYVNVDDCWSEKTRDSHGRVVPDPKRFPSGFAALADYIHQHGMLFGLLLVCSISATKLRLSPPHLYTLPQVSTRLWDQAPAQATRH